MQPMMSISCYLGPGFSYLRNTVCLTYDSHVDTYGIWFNSC